MLVAVARVSQSRQRLHSEARSIFVETCQCAMWLQRVAIWFFVTLVIMSPLPSIANTLPPDFVAIRDLTDLVMEDMRYPTANNFTGKVVPGYDAPKCWLRKEAAEALVKT